MSENAPFPTILTAVKLNTILKEILTARRTRVETEPTCTTPICRMPTLEGTHLGVADLQGANLSDVTNLDQKQIDSANIIAHTILPAGLRQP